ncbi:MAG: glycerophosphodiester phosphodiesterase family protein [Gammaproteobacteria bacterium]
MSSNSTKQPGHKYVNVPWHFRKMPALVAHRGYAQLFPENTLTALAAAVDAGAAFVEFDIQLSKDKVPFLMHDPDLLRTANVDQSVFDLTMTQLAHISVGEPTRLGGRFHSVKPTTLEHACSHLNEWPNVHSFIEIKRQSIEHFGLQVVMEKTFEALATLTAPFTILSFCDDVVEYTKAHSAYSTGWVIRDWNEQSLTKLQQLSPEFVYCNHTKIPTDKPLPNGPWSWVLYEITDEETARFWQARGAHMIESMTVGRLLGSDLFRPQ